MDTDNIIDYLIVGAGPAGLQMGYCLQQAGANYLIVDQASSAGDFFNKFPRHQKLISVNKIHTGFADREINLRWDWNSLLCHDDSFQFSNFSQDYFPAASAMVAYLKAYAERFDLNIQYNCKVKNIKKDNFFIVKTESGKVFLAKKIIIATGLSKPYLPAVKGVEHAVPYTTMTLDKSSYINKRILIIGKGNSAFETADHLIDVASVIHLSSPNSLKMAWRSHYVGHLRAVNNNFLDTYQLKSQNALVNADINMIEKKGNKYIVQFAYNFANDEVENIEYDTVIACSGFRFDNSLFDDGCQPALSIQDRFPAQTSCYQSVNIDGLYFAGTLMQERDFKEKQSGFIHGFRYNIAFLASYLLSKMNQKNLPRQVLDTDAAKITNVIIDKICQSSALWQQTGYLSDILAFCQKTKQWHYYEAMPTEFSHSEQFAYDDYFCISLEYKQCVFDDNPNIFSLHRVHKDDYQNAADSFGLHPIIRHFSNNTLLSEHHLIESFDNIWNKPVHKKPLFDYFYQTFQQDKYANVE